ncbi:MAG: PorP/SprF family type IX secretion system membrane protein [Vicingaceae bacterium]
MNSKRTYWMILAVLTSLSCLAQDFQYSQFYAAPLYLNPAFTGLTDQHRLVVNLRDQWPGLPNSYYSGSISYDRNLESINSGIGFIANGELTGSGQLWRTELAPCYSYQAVIDEKIIIRPALKVGFNMIGINRNKLVFNDQLESGQGTVETQIRPNRFYLDFSSGILVMTERYWGGLALNHLNTPDQSLLENTPEDPIPTKVSIHGGAKFPLPTSGNARATEKDITLVVHYKSQAKFDQFDVGAYYNRNPMVLGIWYRGLPLKSNKQGAINADALTFLMGFRKEGSYSLGFSYDLTISRLSFTRSAGSFEISYIKEWMHKKKKRRRQFIIPCAKF